ncbi:hypothetical protein CLIB1444_01S03158 [[Candida] jaroonii]|uniref:Uncharacterized protein n=1 Tax=[Candida] jaroonii TaxID=467808 RepID=A0ACA9Y033_9ASCO|nr:hypothetical protein CLIB1444_01S03158 [[Candida] jaroonii]
MNFNQQGLNGNGIPPQYGGMGSGNPSNPQQQQQIDIEHQLAKLTPQQLQQLRQKPNLEPIVTSFIQKQQLAQQQMMQQRMGNDQNNMYMNNQSMAGNNPALAAALQKQQMMSRQPRPQMSQQNLQAQMNMRNTNSTALAAAGARQLSQRVPSGPPGQPMGNTFGGVPGAPGAVSGMGAAMGGQPGQFPSGNLPGSGPQIPGQTLGRPMPHSSNSQPPSKVATNQGYTNYPPVPTDVQQKISLKTLSTPDEWSKKLKDEGKEDEITAELKLYEDINAKEFKFKSSSSRQHDSNRHLNEQLIKDLRTYNEIKQLRMKAIHTSSQNQFNNSIWGEGYQGYGNGISNTTSQNILPMNRKRYSKVGESAYSERELNKIILDDLSNNPKRHLVPIRLEFEQERDKFKLRDTFLWDLNEKNITIEQFVEILLEDYKFIHKQHLNTILISVKEQIKDYHQKPEKTMGEIRIPIRINITINNTQFSDQFEWDILNFEENDPEEFSQILCDEMSLPGEFATAIAHTIREQTQIFHKALFLVGYAFDGSAVNEDEIRSHLLPPLRLMSQDKSQYGSLVDDYFSILRNPTSVNDYSPTLTKLTQVEIDKLDKEMERDSRRKRRHVNNDEPSLSLSSRGTSRRGQLHVARGGPVLPDLSDFPKTFRTPQPSSVLPGGVDLGVPDIYSYNEVIVHRTQVANNEFKPPRPKTDRVIFNHDQYNGRFLVRIKYHM